MGVQFWPLWATGFGGSARAVGAGRGCGDGASAGCVIVVAAFEAPAVGSGLGDGTSVGQAVEQRGRHLGIAKHTGPLSECEIGGDDDRRALVEPADEVEQELAAGLSERKVAKFVKDDEVHPGQMLGDTALASVTGLRLKPIDEVDYVVKATAGTRPDAASGAMAMAICVLPVPVPPTSTTLRCWAMNPPPARSLTSVWLIGVPSNWKSSRSLASGSLAMVS